MSTVLTPAAQTAVTSALTQESADALLIKTGLCHLTENHYFNDETGEHFYDLEDGRTVEITAQGEVFLYNFPADDGKAPQQLTVN